MSSDAELQQFTDRVARLLGAGDLDTAGRLVESVKTSDPAAHEIGFTAIALNRRDAATAISHAKLAIEKGAAALGHQFLALGLLMAGDPQGAIDASRRAVALDASPRSRAGLGTVLIAAGRPQDAAAVLRQSVAEDPTNVEAVMNLATACATLGEYGDAIAFYAKAYDADPTSPRAIENLLTMFAELGKWLGALAALQLSRRDNAPPEVTVLYDAAMLQLVRIIADRYPAPGLAPDPDKAVQAAVESAQKRGPRIQLAIARMLVELGRAEEARPLVDALARAKLEGSDRADLLFLQGVYARGGGEGPQGLELYLEALAIDPTHAAACVNATRALLEDGSPAALERAGKLFEAFPAERMTPELLYNEGAWLARRGKRDEARVRLERVLRIAAGTTSIAQLARQALAELAGKR